LTPHVLEHVPDTVEALSELHRVLAPGGSVILMIPMPQGVTAPPKEPEYHGDNTLVYRRFGWDLRDKLESAGFDVTCLVTQPLIACPKGRASAAGRAGGDANEVALPPRAAPATLPPRGDGRRPRRYGFEPDLHFIVWQCAKPAG